MPALEYRKKPVVIKAWRYDPENDADTDLLFEWIEQWERKQFGFSLLEFNMTDQSFTFKTLEGTMRAVPGDYIIEGIAGELYPCKADIFYFSYERVS